MTNAEIGIFKILIKHPRLSRVLQDTLFIEEESVKLFQLIKSETEFEGQITKNVLSTLLRQNEIKIDLNILNEIYRDLDTISPQLDISKRDLLNLVKLQGRESEKDYILKSLIKAQNLVKKNEIIEAHNIVRQINFSVKEEIVPTKQLMLDSIMNTTAFKTGINEIDKTKLAFVKGDLTSIVSDSGAMKTYFCMWFMIMTLIENPNMKGIYFQKEMAVKDMGIRMLSWIVKESSISILSKTVVNHEEAKEEYKKKLEERINESIDDLLNRIIMVPNTMFNTPMDMLRHIESYDVDIWCLDYMTQIKSDNFSFKGQFNNQVMEAVNTLKQIASETESHGIIINQTSKDTTNSIDKRITDAKDIEWSKNIENVSANIYSLFYPWKHRDSFASAPFMNSLKKIPYQKAYYYLIDLKSRHIDSNKPGILKAMPDHARFEEFDEKEYKNARAWYEAYVDYVKNPKRK